MLCRIAEPCNACYDNIYDQLNFEIKIKVLKSCDCRQAGTLCPQVFCLFQSSSLATVRDRSTPVLRLSTCMDVGRLSTSSLTTVVVQGHTVSQLFSSPSPAVL